jgi:hypothetical protein
MEGTTMMYFFVGKFPSHNKAFALIQAKNWNEAMKIQDKNGYGDPFEYYMNKCSQEQWEYWHDIERLPVLN